MDEQRVAPILRQHLDAEETAVDEVAEDEVDDAIAPAERYRWFGPITGERVEALATATGQDHHQDVDHGFPRAGRAPRRVAASPPPRRRFAVTDCDFKLGEWVRFAARGSGDGFSPSSAVRRPSSPPPAAKRTHYAARQRLRSLLRTW